MSSDDLAEFTDIKATQIMQRQCIAYNGTFDLLKMHLLQMFGPSHSRIESTGARAELANEEEGVKVLRVLDCVEVRQHTQGQLLLEWEGDSLNDIVADAVIAVIFKIESHPVSVKMTQHTHTHTHGEHELTAVHQDTKEERL